MIHCKKLITFTFNIFPSVTNRNEAESLDELAVKSVMESELTFGGPQTAPDNGELEKGERTTDNLACPDAV